MTAKKQHTRFIIYTAGILFWTRMTSRIVSFPHKCCSRIESMPRHKPGHKGPILGKFFDHPKQNVHAFDLIVKIEIFDNLAGGCGR
jgi:hypothetical protein